MNREELLERYKKKSERFQRRKISGVIIIAIWIIVLAFGFFVWLKGFFTGGNFVYQPKATVSTLNTIELTKFLFTVSLFALAGNIAQNVFSLFEKFWQIEALGDTLEFAEENNKRFTERQILRLLNSSPTNIVFFRPLFFPLISAILAIPVIFLIYGFNADLPRIAVVSFLTGIISHVVLEQLLNKARWFFEALFATG